MNEKIKQFENKAREIVGDGYVGMARDDAAGQIAVMTSEPDMGENVPAKNYDAVRTAAREVFGRRVSVMPFGIRGRIAYVVAGVNR